MAIKYNNPMKLDNAKAWRTYLGGSLLSQLHGLDKGVDDHFPEEWIMSMTSARNVGREHILEGLSYLADDSTLSLKSVISEQGALLLGQSHYEKYGSELGVLVKLIDSSERLTIQVHPDNAHALSLFDSRFGKTECWHILGGREIDGQKPCIYMGFKEGITREKWVALFEAQDIEGMLGAMHQFEANAGDTVLIKGGVPHAIGAGCFLAEIQEPTDYTIRVEKTTPSGFKVDDYLCHQGLGFDKMFDCFSFEGLSKEEAKARWFISEKVIDSGEGHRSTALIDYASTEHFAMSRIEIDDEMTLSDSDTYSGLYILEGQGVLKKEGYETLLTKGNQFFIPARTDALRIKAKRPITLLQLFGPK